MLRDILFFFDNETEEENKDKKMMMITDDISSRHDDDKVDEDVTSIAESVIKYSNEVEWETSWIIEKGDTRGYFVYI